MPMFCGHIPGFQNPNPTRQGGPPGLELTFVKELVVRVLGAGQRGFVSVSLQELLSFLAAILFALLPTFLTNVFVMRASSH